MKTKEFIKKVKELGFEIIRAGSHIDIMFNDFVIAGVYTDQMHVMTFYSHEKLLLKNIDKLFNLLVEYAKTPVDEREEEKKFYFYLRHRWFTTEFGDKYYLCKCYNSVGDIKYAIRISYFMGNETWLFTLKEIEEIKKEFNTNLADFEMIEVEE